VLLVAAITINLTSLICRRQTRSTRCATANVLQTKWTLSVINTKLTALATVGVLWRQSRESTKFSLGQCSRGKYPYFWDSNLIV